MTAPPSIADAKTRRTATKNITGNNQQPKTRTRCEMAVKGSRARTRRWAYKVRPFPFFFITVFDTQPSKFSCSRPSLARRARRRGLVYIFTFFYHIRTLPPPSLETRDGGVFPSQRAAPTRPKLAPPAEPIRQTRKTRLLACFTCSLHPVEHVKHVRLGVFTCSSPAHPLKHKKYTHLGVFFMFASSLTTQTRKTRPDGRVYALFPFRHNEEGMPASRRVFVSILTRRERVFPSLLCSLCCYFDVASREEGSVPPRHHM